jgi:hypothetical protein
MFGETIHTIILAPKGHVHLTMENAFSPSARVPIVLTSFRIAQKSRESSETRDTLLAVKLQNIKKKFTLNLFIAKGRNSRKL